MAKGDGARTQSNSPQHVRFGSKADVALAKFDVRFTPKADIGSALCYVR
jgi:hypothetical protein